MNLVLAITLLLSIVSNIGLGVWFFYYTKRVGRLVSALTKPVPPSEPPKPMTESRVFEILQEEGKWPPDSSSSP